MVHAEHDRDDVLGLAGPALRDRHVGAERRRAGQRHVHTGDVGDHTLQRVPDLGLADERERRDVVAGAAGADRLEPRRRAHRERFGLEDVLGRAAREVAGELAERPFGLAHAGQDLALDDDLGRRRHGEIDRRARRDLQRLAEESADHLELADVGGWVGERAHGDERVQAERDRARQRLAARLGTPLVLEHPPARVQADAHAVGALDLKAVVALRLDARLGIARDEHAGREVAPGVAGEVGRDRQAAQVEIAAGQHALAKGRAGHDVGLDRVLDAARVLQRQPRLRHAERPRQRAAAGDDIGDDRHVGAGDLLEHQDRPAPAALVLQHQRHDVVVERHGLRHAHDLAGEGALVGGYEVTDALSWHRRHRSSMTCGTNGDSLRVMSPSLSRMPTPADSWSTTQLPTTARRPSYTGSAKYCW